MGCGASTPANVHIPKVESFAHPAVSDKVPFDEQQTSTKAVEVQSATLPTRVEPVESKLAPAEPRQEPNPASAPPLDWLALSELQENSNTKNKDIPATDPPRVINSYNTPYRQPAQVDRVVSDSKYSEVSSQVWADAESTNG
eukprot:CAMPEP_0118955562 /NCGR_PEP_ID=MMETSP1169-20130426/60168_1 /TAXON_ID=36882 /ORGANISM="Pyramimonas obovata, Strain CCMP722" /LENGTH=141 /DNA_ID=CAMNT_0006903435 /DNA_START=346 /DNA_END=767 /DNA_ORIENTATION=-